MAPLMLAYSWSCPCHTTSLMSRAIGNDESATQLGSRFGDWIMHSSHGSQSKLILARKQAVTRTCESNGRVVRFLICPSARGGSGTDRETSSSQVENSVNDLSSRSLGQNTSMTQSMSNEDPASRSQWRRCGSKPCLEGLANAARFARNDADLLARQFARLDERARQDMAFLGSRILVLDARARKDAEKLDTGARHKVQRLRHVALGLEESVSTAAMEHWNDGQLDADLRLADLRARRRALEDSYAAMQIVRMVHRAVADVLLLRAAQEGADTPIVSASRRGSGEEGATEREASLEGQPWQKLSTSDRLLALEEAYRTMLSTSADVDELDYVDSEELEFIVAALVDLDEVGGANGASLVTEAANSPDVATRRALADALSAAPSVWALGNAGIGALQRLAQDSNPTVADAATRALGDLQTQLSQQAASSSLLRFPSDLRPPSPSLGGASTDVFFSESFQQTPEERSTGSGSVSSADLKDCDTSSESSELEQASNWSGQDRSLQGEGWEGGDSVDRSLGRDMDPSEEDLLGEDSGN